MAIRRVLPFHSRERNCFPKRGQEILALPQTPKGGLVVFTTEPMLASPNLDSIPCIATRRRISWPLIPTSLKHSIYLLLLIPTRQVRSANPDPNDRATCWTSATNPTFRHLGTRLFMFQSPLPNPWARPDLQIQKVE